MTWVPDTKASSRVAYGKGETIEQAWLVVYRNPKQHWDLYQLGESALHRFGGKQLHAHLRINPHQVPAPPAVDQYLRQCKNGRFNEHRHRLARGKRRGPAHQVAAVPVGHFWQARLHRFHANLPRQVFGGHRAVAMHQHHQRLRVLILHDGGYFVLRPSIFPRGCGLTTPPQRSHTADPIRTTRRQVGEGTQIEPDWDLASQPSPDFDVNQRVNG